MSVIKSFAHHAHQSLSPLTPSSLKRSHVYELMAAGLGFRSWASLHSAHVLIDGQGVQLPADFARNVLARALQLGLSQTEAEVVAESFHAQCAQKPFGCLALAELDESLFSSPSRADADLELDEDDFDDEEWPDEPGSELIQEPALTSSQVLLDDLKDRAVHGDAFSHYRLAKLLECKVPSDYLYQESLKGRILSSQEQIWADEYVNFKAQREQYELHLRAAADGGVRIAAMVYAAITNDPDYIAAASTMKGVPEEQQWHKPLPEDANNHSYSLEERAEKGDHEAMQQLASHGDSYWLRVVAQSVIEQGESVEAWKWQFVALHHGLDLTESTMRAYHDGGSNAGEFYDSDFGGPMYVDGDEGLVLPKIGDEQKSIAKAMAEQFLSDAAE